jgi:P-type Cu2+ transporter
MQIVPSTEQNPENTSEKRTTAEKITLDIGGMKCAGCVRSVERQLSQYPGIINVCVNLAIEVVVVESEIGVVDPEELAKHLTVGGFPSQPRLPHGKIASDGKNIEEKNDRNRRDMGSALRQLIVAGLLLLLSTLGHFGHILDQLVPGLNNIWFHCGLATIALLIPGRSILVDGWLGLRRNAPNMNTLIGLGTVTAYTASLVALLFPQMGWECFFDEPVMMLGFILLGKTLEQQVRNRATSAFKNLLALQPQVARLIGKPKEAKTQSSLPDSPLPTPFNNGVIEIPAEQVRVGEWLQVLPGEKIPVDGEVVYGQTTVDESMVTGETVPVMRQLGDAVTAGTINQSGAIAIAATRVGSDTTLAQIIALVEAAQTRKAPVQKLADTVAGYFTYFVLSASLLTFLFWYFCGTQIWSGVVGDISMSTTMPMAHLHEYSPQIQTFNTPFLLSLKLAIAVMVVACPCALGLATPMAILVGTAMSAERGLLIKGGDVLETIHKLDTIVFDKTGTLTTGKPTVTDCIVFAEDMNMEAEEGQGGESNSLITSQSLLQIAAAVESGTCHPLATAIQNAAQTQYLSTQELIIPEATDFHTEPGLGVSALVDGKSVLLGNSDWLNWHGVSISDTAISRAQELANEGKTVVYIAVSDRLVGVIAVSDSLRPEAKTTIEKLHQMGLQVMILSGDRIEVATAIAKQLNIDSSNAIAGVPPSKKAATIKMLQDGLFHPEKFRDVGKSVDGVGFRPRSLLNGGNPRTQLLFVKLTHPEGLGPAKFSQHPKSIVAMVGDGINDAPALSQADVGIAMHSGTDVAMETAGIILMRDRLTDVVESIRLSRATFNKIRQNLFWAFAYNTIGIPLAAGILLPSMGFVLNPAGAAALMAFSSLSVVTNSLLLRRVVSSC